MSVHRIGPRTQPSSLPVNDLSRRLAVDRAVAGVEIDVPSGDGERIVFLASLLGEISDAYRFGHKNITDEYLRAAAALHRIVEDDLRRAAR